MAVNLCVAHKKTHSRVAHEVLLVCFLQSFSTQSMDPVQHTKYSSCALMKVNSRVTHEFGLSHSTKIEEHTNVTHTQVST